MRLFIVLLFLTVLIPFSKGQNPLDILLTNKEFEVGRKYCTSNFSEEYVKSNSSINLLHFKEGVLFIPKIKKVIKTDTITLKVVLEGDSIPRIKTNHSLQLPRGRRFIPVYEDRNCISMSNGYVFQFLELNPPLEDEIISIDEWSEERINDFIDEFNKEIHTKEYKINLPQKHEWRLIDSWSLEGKTKMKLGVMPSTYEDEEGNVFVVFEEGYYSNFREVLCSQGPVNRITTKELQQALIEKGYDVKVDDVMSKETKAALIQFQKDNNLPQGNINIETLRALGVQY